MQTTQLAHEEIQIEALEKKEGVFVNENGTEIPYKYYKLKFTIGDNPLIFQAKIDKVFNDYVE